MSKPDPLNYPPTNRDYWDQKYPGIFRPIPKVQQSLAMPTPRKRPKPIPLPLKPPERAGDVCLLWIPLPPPELQTNIKHKINPYKLTKLIRATRDASAFLARQIAPAEPWTAARVDVKCYGIGRMDRDGIIGWLKNVVDGWQKILIHDDNGIEWGTIERFTAKYSEGRREVQIQLTRVA